ncbi:ROK family transcriptional regulator [uncultured Cohaesibacter sp.]|uniref:ROK family transcriptional regulator n=1 Tax=uncultured Cohaesibacter sp. TaxID=1002546 RepID=UPI002930DBFD|nr:ROK family transcriptional regulator [uncultured Cohaesibacter sp.]
MHSYNPSPLISNLFRREGRVEDIVSRNERALLREIWSKPGSSRAELISRLDITQQSVHRIVEHLADREILRLGAPKPASGRGQPSPTLQLNPDWAYSIGISLNTDKVDIVLMDLAGNFSTRRVQIRDKSMASALDEILAAGKALAEERNLSEDKLFGVGFGIAGYLVEGTKYNAPLPLHEWSLIELGPLLSERFEAPVWTENGANTAAICEAMFGVGRYIKSFAYLSFNFGFGGGIIVDGELLRGGHGNAGEMSGIYDSGENYKRPALEFLLKSLAKHDVPVDSINQLARNFKPDWPGVAEWIDMVTPSHNRIINALSAIIDPQAIVYGGEIPRELAEMLIARAKFFNRPRYGVPRKVPKLIISELASQHPAMGAAMLPFKAELM